MSDSLEVPLPTQKEKKPSGGFRAFLESLNPFKPKDPEQEDLIDELRSNAAPPETLEDSVAKLPEEKPTPERLN